MKHTFFNRFSPKTITAFVAGCILLAISPKSFSAVLSYTDEIVVKDDQVVGKVRDKDGQTLEGIKVTVKGTRITAMTNANGNYKIDVPSSEAVLVFEHKDRRTQEQAVNGRERVNVVLFHTNDDSRTIVGKIKNQAGETVQGVVVTLKGTETSVKTNSNGNYTIIVPNEDAVLRFEYPGAKAQEHTVKARERINITLKSGN